MCNYRKTYAKVRLDHILYNLNYVKHLNPNKEIIPVVKANAYGHGAYEVVKFLVEEGVTFFAVSLLEEALELREHFKDIKILVMGVVDNDGFDIASDEDITLTISNFDQLDSLLRFNKKLDVHIKVDTGMNRLGFKDLEEISSVVNQLSKLNHINLEGIFSHFSTADSNFSYFKEQEKRFEDIISSVDHSFKYVHISNSSSGIKYEKDIHYTTHIRLGISLYGLTLDSETTELKPAMSLHTKISQINTLKPGDKLGYGATYTSKNGDLIGVLPIGYADGFIRKNQTGFVEINQKLYPILGRICMDQMFVKIDNSVSKDDDVILFGGLVSIDDIAERLDTINYEVVCQITYRVPKKYIT